MSYRNRRRNERAITLRVVCAVAFLLFTFFWLYFFQGDILAVAQHELSGGKTHYNRTIGAIIVTVVLFGLHLLVFVLTRLTRRTHALTYLPSMLLLAFVSSISVPFRWGAWLWAAPLVLLLWGGAVWLSKQLLPIGEAMENRNRLQLFSRVTWINMLQLAFMMIGVAAVSNTNAVQHFRAHVEVALMEDNVDEALRTGNCSLETDESLTMLRIFALSQKGQLADHLFEYTISGTSADMLPMKGSKGQLMLMTDTLLWQHFGVSPDSMMSTHLSVAQYLDSLECDTLATPAWRDYKLMGQLIDRRLDTFVVCLPRYYKMEADSLPRHYREALVLYQQAVDTSFIYSDSLMLSSWYDFHINDSIYPKVTERRIRTEGQFRGTYWYYYFQP
jgi:hypothetical protein